jgi:hypothetical protein
MLVSHLLFRLLMRHTIKIVVVVGLLVGGVIAPMLLASSNAKAMKQQVGISANDKETIAAFETRTKEYVKLRERLERTMPKLSKDATPEQIETHKITLQEKVRAARAASKPGQLFTTDIADVIRTIIRDEFKGRDRVELRETVFEAETQGVPMRVNYPYPEAEELLEMPPTLLLRLPQLPKQLRYRFVGRNMLLVDRENALIIDFMTNAIP